MGSTDISIKVTAGAEQQIRLEKQFSMKKATLADTQPVITEDIIKQ